MMHMQPRLAVIGPSLDRLGLICLAGSFGCVQRFTLPGFSDGLMVLTLDVWRVDKFRFQYWLGTDRRSLRPSSFAFIGHISRAQPLQASFSHIWVFSLTFEIKPVLARALVVLPTISQHFVFHLLLRIALDKATFLAEVASLSVTVLLGKALAQSKPWT